MQKFFVLIILAFLGLQAGATGSADNLHFLMQIRPAYKQICADCRLEFSEIRVSTQFPDLAKTAQVRTEGLRWGKSFLLPLVHDGKDIGWVSGQVKIMKLGLRALKAIPQGQTLRSDDFRPDWIEITLSKDQLAQAEDLKAVDSRRFLSVREPLMKGDLKKSKLISRGQVISVVTGNDGFEVATQMKAEENGSWGDIIRVKSTETSKVLSVRVQEDGSGRFE